MLRLTQLTHNNQPFICSLDAPEAFESLKWAFTTTPILAHIDLTKRFILEADASDFALGSVLSQTRDDEQLHHVAVYSRKFDTAEINYEIHDK